MQTTILHKSQQIIVRDPAKFKVCSCGAGFGKTEIAVKEAKFQAFRPWDKIGTKPLYKYSGNVVYIAPTIPQARRIVWDRLKYELKDVTKSVNESRLEIKIYNCRYDPESEDQDDPGMYSQVFLTGWENIENVRGIEVDWFIIDEVAMMRNFKDKWQKVLRSRLRMSNGGALMISTPRGFNHFRDLFLQAKEMHNWASFKFSSYDNPFIDRAFLEETREQTSPESFAQEYLAEFVKHEGLVYKQFDIDKHVIGPDEVPKIKEYIMGIDFGFENPLVVLYIGVGYDGKFYVLDEFYETKAHDEQAITWAQQRPVQYVYPDPNNAQGVDKFKQAGLPVHPVKKGPGSVQSGIQTVRDLLVQGRLFIHAYCTNTIDEFMRYEYAEPKNPDVNKKEDPIKANDHAMDALRYAVTTYGKRDHIQEAEKRAERRRKRNGRKRGINYVPR